MTIAQAIILGGLEGITEFLPISSTGHLMVAGHMLGLPSSDAQKTFDVVIQLGAILAVVTSHTQVILRSPRLLWLSIIGFVPTACIGFALHGVVRSVFLSSIPLVGWSLLLGGIALLGFERYLVAQKRKTHHILTSLRAAGIGTAQSLALIPGVSRSAAAIVGGMLLGLPRREAVTFSFLLALPTMLAASSLDLLATSASLDAHDWMMLGIGSLTAFITAHTAVRWLLRYVEHHSFRAFGWYRIAAGALILLLI